MNDKQALEFVFEKMPLMYERFYEKFLMIYGDTFFDPKKLPKNSSCFEEVTLNKDNLIFETTYEVYYCNDTDVYDVDLSIEEVLMGEVEWQEHLRLEKFERTKRQREREEARLMEEQKKKRLAEEKAKEDRRLHYELLKKEFEGEQL